MSTEIATRRKAGAVANYQPQEAKRNIAKDDALIDFAKRTRDWPLLEQAVDAKLDDQEEFVRWWDERVRPHGVRADVAEPGHLAAPVAEELTGITKQQVSRWRKRLVDRPAYRAALYEHAYRKAMNLNKDGDASNDTSHKTAFTGAQEWFTPEEYILMARTVLGDIDLDPASNEIAQRTVLARKFFSKQDDGLAQEWHGRVWLNPPYSQPAIDDFITKLVLEYRQGNVIAAILLTHNSTDTAWFHRALEAASGICFTRGRVRFSSPSGELASPTQGQAFFYFGADYEAFRSVFSRSGAILGIDSPMAA